MDIYILSSGRSNKQTTWASLPRDVQARTKIVVPHNEREAYKAFPLFSTPPEIKGIGPTRQWVLENSVKKVVMLDDDLVFAMRREDNPSLFQNATDAEVVKLFKDIETHLDDHAHVGVATREGGNRNTEDYILNTRMMRILAYDAELVRGHKLKYHRVQFMEDFDMTLQLLRLGYSNLLINWVVQNQSGSNLQGGCSQYRNVQTQELAAHMLKEHHPDFVRVVIKQTQVAWTGMKQRTDVVISWKKAYSEGATKYGSR